MVNYSDTKYHQIRQKSAHNSFQRNESYNSQLNFHRNRSSELDIHDDGPVGDWKVYHTWLDNGTMTDLLSDALAEYRAFHDANPNHQVITIWIDVKDSFDTGNHSVSKFETLLTKWIPSSNIYSPSDLKGSYSDLKTAAEDAAWSSLPDLEGKFIFVLTDEVTSYTNSSSDAVNRTAFVAKAVSNKTDVDNAEDWYVFYNSGTAPDSSDTDDPYMFCETKGYVSRHWTANSSTAWSNAKSAKVGHISTDKINYIQDSWAKTHYTNGFPFERLDNQVIKKDGTQDEKSETQNVASVKVKSGDIYGGSVDANFRYLTENNSTGVWKEWTVCISSEQDGSKIDKNAKAGIMVRNNLSSESADYFAIIKHSDSTDLRSQQRKSGSYSQTTVEIPSSGCEQQNRSYVKLRYKYDGTDTTVEVYGAMSGVGSDFNSIDSAKIDENWTLVKSETFSGVQLQYQGICTSSKSSSNEAIFYYVNLKKDGVIKQNSDLTSVNIGSVTSTSATDLWIEGV
jgi:hypothetical protein